MFKIKTKEFFSIITSKIVLKLSKTFFKGGSNFPGKVALKICPDILKTIGSGYRVIIVTGTNGKTTTTSMINSILESSGKKVITNSTGANMLPGVVACFIENFSFKGTNEDKFAVMEVDEANVKFITKHLKPEIITITNLFRDQLDRYGEVYTTLNKILEGVTLTPESKLVLNGDESLLGDLNLENPVLYYGFNVPIDENKKIDVNADAKFCKKCKAPYKYGFVTYNHLGDYYCDNCGFKRPELKYSIDKILEVTHDYSSVSINGKEVSINQPGTYNIYNGICAYSICRELSIEENAIINSLKNQQSSFGRQEEINIDGKEIKIILVKNPAGYDEALNTITLNKDSIDMCFLLNDNYADGRDVSWIWDVNFEKLKDLSIGKIFVGGSRLYDMAIRLKIAGLPEDNFSLCQTHDSLLENIKNCPNNKIYVLATYTAMIDFRKFLHSKGYINKLW
ncbi:Mur ligase family protein [Haloimpatiens lingqiaonensis]|uniref:Mur ligase family protein n=1 Tax=Haloimpatiens lingqiaonensis TaxID=1380675 RepID=UPI0010FF2F67|nr:Mur ligase family protein [Haloimpatiens lingqiaonensis]